jgi:hypothetical protein
VNPPANHDAEILQAMVDRSDTITLRRAVASRRRAGRWSRSLEAKW